MKIDGELVRSIILFVFFTIVLILFMAGGCKSYDDLANLLKRYG